MVFEKMQGKFEPIGEPAEVIQKVKSSADGTTGFAKKTIVNGQAVECSIRWDASGNIVKTGNDACLATLEQDIRRINNPITGQTNAGMLREAPPV